MKPYRVDFVNGRCHEMTLDREGGIKRSDLDELEINMLRSQRVPSLLPLEWMEMDGHVTFRYALGGKKMLLHRLQQQPLTMEQFYGLLLRVVTALMECRDYMLRPEGCMLGDMFLFVGERIEDVSFVYVPLRSRKEESASGDDLLAMAARWTSYIEHVDGEGLRDVLSFFNGNRWPLMELREHLLEVLGSRVIYQADKEEVDTPDFRSADQRSLDSSIYGHRLEPKPPVHDIQQARVSGLNGKPQDILSRDAESKDIKLSEAESRKTKLREEEQAQRSYLELESVESAMANNMPRRRWIIALTFVLGAACLWRFLYLDNPSAQTMLVSLGLTILLLAGAVWMWRRGDELILRKSVLDDDPDAESLSDSFELQSQPMPAKERWTQQADYRELGIEHRSSATTSSLGNYSVPHEPRREHMQGRETTQQPGLLAPTTVLEGQDAGAAGAGLSGGDKVLLRRSWNGKEEEIVLQTEVFQVGRGCGRKGYEEKADGVSRIHLEIVKEQGCHVAKDLGSRNGSLLNGTLMIPYKSYPLAAGDTIQLAGNKGPSYQFQVS